MKKNKIQKLNKLNNKGVTLVEIIVAMAILAVVVVPFVHSFVTAANTNRKAKETLNGTTIAEDIMEMFEDVNVEKEASDIGALINAETALGVADAGSVSVDGSGIYTIEMGSEALAKYVGEAFAGDGYTAKVVLDPCNNTTDSFGNTVNGIYDVYNTANVANVATVDSKHDGIYAMSFSFDADQCDTISKKSFGAENYTKDAVMAGVTRTITVEIIDNNKQLSSGIQFVKAKITVKYQYGTYTETTQSFVYDNTVEGGQKAYEFKNLYLLYTPIYCVAGTNNTKDSLIINNDSNIPFTLYILHEKTAADTTGGVGGFSNYKLPISITEGKSDTLVDMHYSPSVSIRTNLFDITKTGEIDDFSKTNYTISYRPNSGASATSYTNVNKTNAELLNTILKVKSADGRNIFKDSIVSNRIFDMKVYVYRNGKELVNISGTKLNKAE